MLSAVSGAALVFRFGSGVAHLMLSLMGDGALFVLLLLGALVFVVVVIFRSNAVKDYISASDRAARSSSATPTSQPKPRGVLSAEERRRVAAEIVAAEDASGSHWVEGVAVAERYGVSVFDVHDEVMAILDRREAAEVAAASRVRNVRLKDGAMPEDYGAGGALVRAVGDSYWVKPETVAALSVDHFIVVREPRNKHDANALAVYADGRKVGYVSAARASTYAPLLDALGVSRVRVARDGEDGLRFRLPSLTVLRREVAAREG